MSRDCAIALQPGQQEGHSISKKKERKTVPLRSKGDFADGMKDTNLEVGDCPGLSSRAQSHQKAERRPPLWSEGAETIGERTEVAAEGPAPASSDSGGGGREPVDMRGFWMLEKAGKP